MASRTAIAAMAAAAVSAQVPVPTPMVACRFPLTDPSGQNTLATWDLSAAFNATADYVWFDRNDAYVKNNTYYFQVCSDTIATPSACASASPAPAYQVDATNACYELGKSLNNARPALMNYQPSDWRNPTRGVAMTYMAGNSQFCPAGPRTYTINFWCAPFPFPVAGPPDPNANQTWNKQYWIDEFNACNYVANVYSIQGCPLECPRAASGQLCSGNGVCGFDNNLFKARCFCNDDYIEADCSTPRYPYPGGSVAGSVIGGMLLGLAGAVGAVFFIQKRRASAGAVDGFYGVVA